MAVAMCPKGLHEKTEENTARSSSGTYCRPCNKEYMRARREREREERGGPLIFTRRCRHCKLEFKSIFPRQHYCCTEHADEAKRIRSRERTADSRLPVQPLIDYAAERGIFFDVKGWPDGKVGFFEADEYAVKYLGTHPALIFGKSWWKAAAA